MLAESEFRWRLIGYFVQCACMALDTPFLLFAHGITTCTGSLVFGAARRFTAMLHICMVQSRQGTVETIKLYLRICPPVFPLPLQNT